MAECDLPWCNIPSFHVIGHHALQFQLINIENRLITGVGKFLREAVCKIECSDTIAIERSDFPHDMIPDTVLENDRFMSPLVVLVRQFVRAVIVQHQGTRNRGRTNDLGVDPERDAVVPAPVFARKLSRRDKIFPLPATVNLGDIGSRADSQRMPAFFDVDVRQCHLSQAGKRPGGEVFHAVEQTRIEDLLVQPSEFSAVFIRRLHWHLGSSLLCRERHAQTKGAQECSNTEPEHLDRPSARY